MFQSQCKGNTSPSFTQTSLSLSCPNRAHDCALPLYQGFTKEYFYWLCKVNYKHSQKVTTQSLSKVWVFWQPTKAGQPYKEENSSSRSAHALGRARLHVRTGTLAHMAHARKGAGPSGFLFLFLLLFFIIGVWGKFSFFFCFFSFPFPRGKQVSEFPTKSLHLLINQRSYKDTSESLSEFLTEKLTEFLTAFSRFCYFRIANQCIIFTAIFHPIQIVLCVNVCVNFITTCR